MNEIRMFINGDSFSDLYNQCHLYDENGVFMTFDSVSLIILCRVPVNGISFDNRYTGLDTSLASPKTIIQPEKKAKKDALFADEIHWNISGDIRKARKLDFTKNDMFSYKTTKQNYFSPTRDIYIPCEKHIFYNTLLKTGWGNKHESIYTDVVKVGGKFVCKGCEYFQYKLSDIDNKFEVLKQAIDDITIDELYTTTSSMFKFVDDESRTQTKKLTEKINQIAHLSLNYMELERILEHFEIKEKE